MNTVPVGFQYIWQMYLELKKSEPLSFLEIKAYSDLMDLKLDKLHCEILMTIDRIYWKELT